MAKDYSKLEKEDLLKIIEKLESRKKYGLIWDEEKTKERFEKESENALPVLKEVKGKEIKTDSKKPTNILIEGDNYHALSVLNYTHQGKIDVIYIDPPYNRGGDFKYNDDYVDREDPYRHSKWLSFMQKRLKLAKKLLKDDGVIFISIDDNEVSQLRMLLDNDVFSETMAVGPIIWQKASGGGNAKQIVMGHEYILCYGNQDITFTQKNHKHDGKKLDKSKKYIEKDGDWYFIDDDVVRKYFGKYPKGVERRCEYEDLLKYKSESQKREIDLKIKAGEYILISNPKNKKKHFICALEKVGGLRMVLYSIIKGIFNAEGKEDLVKDGLPENAFDYPKPVRLIKILLDSISKKDGVILDFFAGSGTTSKAVLELNSEDEGRRQFILCTNDEGNICTEVTYPRIKNIIKGHTIGEEKIKGLGGNLKYFKTAFVPKDEVSDDTRKKLVSQSTEMICLREGTHESKIDNANFKIFSDGNKITGILFNLKKLEDFKKKVASYKLPASLYVFSLSDDTYNEDFADLPVKYKLVPIPESILEAYRKLFKKI